MGQYKASKDTFYISYLIFQSNLGLKNQWFKIEKSHTVVGGWGGKINTKKCDILFDWHLTLTPTFISAFSKWSLSVKSGSGLSSITCRKLDQVKTWEWPIIKRLLQGKGSSMLAVKQLCKFFETLSWDGDNTFSRTNFGQGAKFGQIYFVT